MTRRRHAEDERIPVPPEKWYFARVEGGGGLGNQGAEQAVGAVRHAYIHPVRIRIRTRWIYELVYTGRDPLALGLGMDALRAD